MDKERQELAIGYKKPPRHTRFKPGQSGNSSGRPKKKPSTFTESFERELNTSITASENGKPQRLTKLQAIVKQQTNKALNGDPKATTLVMKAVAARQPDPVDSLAPMLREMRAIHAKHETADRNNSSSTKISDSDEDSANNQKDEHNDQD